MDQNILSWICLIALEDMIHAIVINNMMDQSGGENKDYSQWFQSNKPFFLAKISTQ